MILLPSRYNGPARSANGGYTAGTLAERVPGDEQLPVEVTLRQPPPLETPLDVEESDGRTLLLCGDPVSASVIGCCRFREV